MGNKASKDENDGRGVDYQPPKKKARDLIAETAGKGYHLKSPADLAVALDSNVLEGLSLPTVESRLRVRPPFYGDPKLRARYKDLGLLPTAEVKRLGEDWARIDAHDLVPGDLVRVKAGDVIPQDLRIVR